MNLLARKDLLEYLESAELVFLEIELLSGQIWVADQHHHRRPLQTHLQCSASFYLESGHRLVPVCGP